MVFCSSWNDDSAGTATPRLFLTSCLGRQSGYPLPGRHDFFASLSPRWASPRRGSDEPFAVLSVVTASSGKDEAMKAGNVLVAVGLVLLLLAIVAAVLTGSSWVEVGVLCLMAFALVGAVALVRRPHV